MDEYEQDCMEFNTLFRNLKRYWCASEKVSNLPRDGTVSKNAKNDVKSTYLKKTIHGFEKNQNI